MCFIEAEALGGYDGCNQSQDQADITEFSPGLNSTATELSSSLSSMPFTFSEAIELSQRATRKKRTYSGNDKLLELSKEESLQFKKICD